MANKSLMRKMLREYKKRPIIKYAPPVLQKKYQYRGQELQPRTMAQEIHITPWDMEKDPLHEQRAVGLMFQQFIKHIGPTDMLLKREIQPGGNKLIRATLIIMVPAEYNATWDDYNTAPVIVDGVASMGGEHSTDAARYMFDALTKKERDIWRGENEGRRGANSYDPENFL